MDLHDLGREVAVGRRVPPEGVDVERLNVNSALVHFGEAVGAESAAAAAGVALERSAFDDVGNFRNGGVRVHVDDFDALAADANFAARRLRQGEILPLPWGGGLRRCGAEGEFIQKPVSGGEYCRRRTYNCLHELPAIAHGVLLGGSDKALDTRCDSIPP